MTVRHIGFIIILAAALVQPASGGEESPLTDEGELSFVQLKGNSELLTLSGKNLLRYTFENKVACAWKAEVLYGETEGDRSAESYLSELRVDYPWNDRFYTAGILGWERNEFSGFDARLYGGPIVGYRFLTGPEHLLTGEVGIQYAAEYYTDDTDDSFLEGRSLGTYEYLFSETNRFVQSLEAFCDFEESSNYVFKSETAFISEINRTLSLKTGYKVTYDHEPFSEELKKTDTRLSVTLMANIR